MEKQQLIFTSPALLSKSEQKPSNLTTLSCQWALAQLCHLILPMWKARV